MGAAGIATGTVLSRAGGTLNHSGLIATIFFGVTAIVATWILRPRGDAWLFTSSASIIFETAETRSLTEEAVLEWVGNVNQDNYVKNKAKLDGLYNALTCGCVALVIAIVAAVVSLAP